VSLQGADPALGAPPSSLGARRRISTASIFIPLRDEVRILNSAQKLTSL
jgi:hypothetical protein